MRKARRPVAVEVACRDESVEPDGLWCIAMLRVAAELKRSQRRSLSEIVARVTERMGLPQREFESYLRSQCAALGAAADRL